MNAKKILLLFVLLTGFAATKAIAASNVKITFRFKFINIEAGYDHISRMKVYVDGNLAGTSPEKKESELNTVVVEVSKGFHTIRAVVESLYEGNWEEHIAANDYSIDCLYERSMKYTKKNTNIIIDFDINVGTVIKKK